MSEQFGLGWLPSPPDWAHMPLAERFWTRVDKTSGCWLWTGGANAAGYGSMRVSGVRRQASWVSWFLAHDEAPADGLYVCHRCDNPRCVRPDHLFLGSPIDNMVDMESKGRSRRPRLPGVANGRALLTLADVQFIRSFAYARHYGMRRDLARRFGVHVRTIGMVWAGRTWREEISHV